MSKEDACTARDSGVDGIVVSNHGGRQRDGTVSPLRVLPTIADAVGATTPVMMEGGVGRGSDVLKAVALGAPFVFVGRPFVYAAAVGGTAGVRHAINILSSEIGRNMGLLGINSLAEMHPDRLLRLSGVDGAALESSAGTGGCRWKNSPARPGAPIGGMELLERRHHSVCRQ